MFLLPWKTETHKDPEPGDAPDPYIDATTNLKALELAIIISKAYLLSNHSIYHEVCVSDELDDTGGVVERFTAQTKLQ